LREFWKATFELHRVVLRPKDKNAVNVLFIGPLPEPLTGHSLACQVLLDELRRHHRVEVVNLSKRSLKNGIDSIGRIVQVLKILFDVWRKQRSADVIYFTVSESLSGNVKDLLIYLLCFQRLERMVIHLHGGAGLRTIMLGRGGPQRWLNEFFVRRLGGAIVLGGRHADVFARALATTKIHIVPNFAEDYLFAPAESIDDKFQSPSPLRILFLSNLIPGKGYIELLDAFFGLDETAQASVTVDLAGAFASERDKRALLDRIDGVAQIRYHGVVQGERKRALFRQAHVFCLPTYFPYEGQPISLLEAYASGCAVITTDHSGIRDVFVPEANGYEVAKRSASSLRTAINRALANTECLRAMATRNLALAQREYRESRFKANIIQILDRAGAHE